MHPSWLTALFWRRWIFNGEKHQYEPFRYKSLTEDDSFRVIVLEPGDYQDDIRCHFQNHQLTSPPEYEALSYVWGDHSRALSLLSDGSQILITKTLDLALRRLRLPQTTRVLWIDQLCINQEDFDERSRQVQLMKSIYSKAMRVLVWLGSDDDMQAKGVKELIGKIENVWGDEIGTNRFPKNEDLAERGLPLREAPCWTDLSRMLEKPYFTRIWVVQECRVASNLLLIWGMEEITWTEFAHTIFWTHLNCAFARDTTGLDLGHLEPQLNLDAEILMSQMNTNRFFGKPDYENWMSLLVATRNYKASDSRDKLFALLGLFGENGPSIKPDYRKSSSEVFSEFVREMIPKMQTLQLLSYADSTSVSRFPLWAPRWDTNDKLPGVLEDYSFKASGSTTPRFEDSSESEILDLEGVLLDSVDRTTMPLEETRDVNSSSRVQDAWDLAISGNLPGPSPYAEWTLPIVAFAWTLTAGHTVRLGYPIGSPADTTHLLDFAAYQVNELLLYMSEAVRESPCSRAVLQLGLEAQHAFLELEKDSDVRAKALSNESKAWFQDFMRLVHSQKESTAIANPAWDSVEKLLDPDRSLRFQTTLVRKGLGRRFFVTHQGYMGIGSPVMESGDKVCVLFGGSTLYIVRPTSKPDEYLFLGECYVHGLMNGEAIKLWEEGKIESQRFRLR